MSRMIGRLFTSVDHRVAYNIQGFNILTFTSVKRRDAYVSRAASLTDEQYRRERTGGYSNSDPAGFRSRVCLEFVESF